MSVLHFQVIDPQMTFLKKEAKCKKQGKRKKKAFKRNKTHSAFFGC